MVSVSVQTVLSKTCPAAHLLGDDSKLLAHAVRRGLAKEGQSVGFSSICSTPPLIPHHLTPVCSAPGYPGLQHSQEVLSQIRRILHHPLLSILEKLAFQNKCFIGGMRHGAFTKLLFAGSNAINLLSVIITSGRGKMNVQHT